MTTPLKLGDIARDRITGCEGVVVAITEWLNGCRRLTLQPQSLHEGKPVEADTFDEMQLVRTGQWEPTQKETGGPRPAPTRPGVPR